MGIIDLDKKGIFFTFISISIVTMMLILTSASRYKEVEQDISAVKIRTSALNNYVINLEEVYLERALYATSYKAITSLIIYINKTGKFLEDFGVFEEVIVNGTVNSENIDLKTGEKIMENHTLTNWTNRIADIAKDTLKADTEFSINRVNITQSRPWYVEVFLNISYTVNSTTASWERKDVGIKTKLDITYFYDPYCLVNGNQTRKIKKSSVAYDEWNINTLKQHIENSTYTHFEEGSAPSFLMRFLNDTSNSSCCGIESMVNPNNISQSDVVESYVDYLFWNHTYLNRCDYLYNITGVYPKYSGFKLDIKHMALYNITEGEAVRTCE